MKSKFEIVKEDLLKLLGFAPCLGSKSGYRRMFPDNSVIFNANIVAVYDKIHSAKFKDLELYETRFEDIEKVWHGDLDLSSITSDLLLKISNKYRDVQFLILYEMDARFGNENNPLIKNYIFSYHNGSIQINPKYEKYFKIIDGSKIININR